MNTITNETIKAAGDLITSFCQANQINLNKEILKTPVVELREFFRNRDQSGFNYSIEEAYDDLGDSEAMIIIDDITESPVILYDELRMCKLDFDEQVQVLIHEYLHYYEAIELYLSEGLCSTSDNPDEDEAEDELISLVISLYPDEIIEKSLRKLDKRIDPEKLIETYNRKEVAYFMLKKISTIGRSEAAKRLQIR